MQNEKLGAESLYMTRRIAQELAAVRSAAGPAARERHEELVVAYRFRLFALQAREQSPTGKAQLARGVRHAPPIAMPTTDIIPVELTCVA